MRYVLNVQLTRYRQAANRITAKPASRTGDRGEISPQEWKSGSSALSGVKKLGKEKLPHLLHLPTLTRRVSFVSRSNPATSKRLVRTWLKWIVLNRHHFEEILTDCVGQWTFLTSVDSGFSGPAGIHIQPLSIILHGHCPSAFFLSPVGTWFNSQLLSGARLRCVIATDKYHRPKVMWTLHTSAFVKLSLRALVGLETGNQSVGWTRCFPRWFTILRSDQKQWSTIPNVLNSTTT